MNSEITQSEVLDAMAEVSLGREDVDTFNAFDRRNESREHEIFFRGLANDYRIMQPVRLDNNDRDHVQKLLDYIDPPENARILDVGCGIGEVAKIMKEIRPDLSFVLLEPDEEKVKLIQDGLGTVINDYAFWSVMDELPEDAEKFDVVMYNYSIGYIDLKRVFPMARDALKDGGKLFIYDVATDSVFTQIVILASLGYKIRAIAEYNIAARYYGFTVDQVEVPEEHQVHAYVEGLFGGIENFATTFRNAVPVVISMTKDPKVDDEPSE